MKKVLSFILCLLMVITVQALQPAMSLTGQDYNLKVYLDSVQKALQGETVWNSITATEAATSSYTTTTTMYQLIRLVDDDARPMYWFNDTVSGFSVVATVSSSTAASSTAGATIGTDTLTFYAGSAPATITLTGTWSVGDSVALSAPALSIGIGTVSLKSQAILTFTTN